MSVMTNPRSVSFQQLEGLKLMTQLQRKKKKIAFTPLHRLKFRILVP